MSFTSMTGFARAEGSDEQRSWAWEIRSVNGRGLDIKFRLPAGFDTLEAPARRLVIERVRRGNVAVMLQITDTRPTIAYRINHDLLRQVAKMVQEVEQVTGASPPTADGLLSLRGIIEQVEQEIVPGALGEQSGSLLDTFSDALNNFQSRKIDEGRHLTSVVVGLLNEIDELIKRAAASAEIRPDAVKARLRMQMDEILGSAIKVSEERLAQEIALLVTKADVREELDRLKAHIDAARQIVATGGDKNGAGRQLDFLTQEFNREANTLCSKSGDLALTQIGLALKLAIDRLREQVQNIE